MGLFLGREGNFHGGAFPPSFRFGDYFTPLCSHQRFADSQTEPHLTGVRCTRFISPVKTVKYKRKVSRIDPRSVIFDKNTHFIFVHGRKGNFAIFCGIS